MKLAEALLLRRDLNNRLFQLRNEISSSVLVQEGDTLDRSITELFKEYDEINQQYSELVVAINRKNATASLADSALLLMEALEQREQLRRKHALLTQALDETKAAPRVGRNEIRLVRTIDTKTLTEQLNTTAKHLRELDGKIQQTNWLVDL
ncbi:DIP1984 family protein [Enterococcus casseliflavus]|uniref:DIP1984 family protein n=1 Tax=Enterococcus casseliflavus TaxID=37734 RepID=UPI00232D6431|nr:DIP1984 family protein [Enterococcus casseliflavus]MDB1694275.1 DIP1984 family protein [Enterococcus casseliflavus]MDB1697707.1 DIP1984 family protein [Enterococcus casseliflavus]MDB1703271.1 DIP1984 family protein [Enterococcus casseliflavus]MDB1704430.1 DIP1984 family protein [Enterococcus casseliflavus]